MWRLVVRAVCIQLGAVVRDLQGITISVSICIGVPRGKERTLESVLSNVCVGLIELSEPPFVMRDCGALDTEPLIVISMSLAKRINAQTH